MRTLKYAILGLLNQKDMTGYEMSEMFSSTLNEFWHANHSQIYPELQRLTDEGMVRYTEEISGQVLKKKRYALTDEGRTDFMAWLRRDEAIGATPKDTFRLRMFYSSSLPEEERRDLIEKQIARHTERKSHLEKNQKKFDAIPGPDEDAFGDYLVLMGAIMREEMTIAWMEKCLELCEG